jgi:hypothetical protein
MTEVGIETCISAANWDKQSTWEALARKLKIKSWQQILKGTKPNPSLTKDL